MTSRPAEIWLADIPYTSGSASKLRPVLVLWLAAANAVVAAVTSALLDSPANVPSRFADYVEAADLLPRLQISVRT